jgi:hypothetical protein
MPNRNQAGRATGSLILLLLILSCAGGWNYHRHWQIEKATEGVRPYESFAVDDLEVLRDAYVSELHGVRAEFDSARRNRVRAVRDVGSIAGNIEQFQETTRASTAIRMAAASVSEREEQISELDREIEMRSRFGQGLGRHLKRLTAI